MPKKVIMPALGMAQESGLLLAWLKNEGDSVQQGDALMEIETDKITVEIEANATGKLVNLTAQAGDDVPVGEVIAYILLDGETLDDLPQTSPKQAKPQTVDSAKNNKQRSVSPVAARMLKDHALIEDNIPSQNNRIRKSDVEAYLNQQTMTSQTRLLPASPKARRLAHENGYNLEDITGSGPDGAVITSDVIAYSPPVAVSHQPDVVEPAPERIETSRLWQVMASRLSQSWQTIPHFYLKRNVNVDTLIDWRESLRTNTSSVTYTDLLVKIVATALVHHPQLNARMVDNQLYSDSDINIGLAVAVEDGLLVPVIHQADQLGINKIARQRAELVQKAQSNRLQPSDMLGGTFTISNLGMYGVDEFSAIVNPPQVAILAVGSIQSRLEMIDNQIAETKFMTLSLSCDHRAVDGARGAQFLQTLASYMQEPRLMLS